VEITGGVFMENLEEVKYVKIDACGKAINVIRCDKEEIEIKCSSGYNSYYDSNETLTISNLEDKLTLFIPNGKKIGLDISDDKGENEIYLAGNDDNFLVFSELRVKAPNYTLKLENVSIDKEIFVKTRIIKAFDGLPRPSEVDFQFKYIGLINTSKLDDSNGCRKMGHIKKLK